VPSQTRVRPFTSNDYDFLIEMEHVVLGESTRSIEQCRHADAARDPALFFARHVVMLDDQRLGCGEIGHSSWIDDPDTYWLQVLIRPNVDDPSIRKDYLAFVLDVLAVRAPRALVSGMRESRRDDVRFLEDNGFREVHREHWSRLDLSAFDPERFASKVARVIDEGIRLMPLADLLSDLPDWKERLHRVYQQLVADQPAAHPPRLKTLEQWDRTVLASPGFDASLWILAIDGGRIVGLSQAGVNRDAAETMRCGLTGVVSSHRRRGIATALKAALLQAAKTAGATEITTTNETNNPMYRINLGLGFMPEPDWVLYEKTL
jgi:GNAT superfamily N-acetyltransferase